MSELLARAEPVPSACHVAAGVTIALAPPMARYSLRARKALELEILLGLKVPEKIGATDAGIMCLGPDEWLMRAAVGTIIPMGEACTVAVTDVSDRSICLIIEGARSVEILMSGCPLDLDKFPVGRATRTIFETVEIIVIRDADCRFQVEIWCSFASWLWTALTTAASH